MRKNLLLNVLAIGAVAVGLASSNAFLTSYSDVSQPLSFLFSFSIITLSSFLCQ